MSTLIAGTDLAHLLTPIGLYFLVPLARASAALMIGVGAERRMPNARPPSSEDAWFNVRCMVVMFAVIAPLRPLALGVPLMLTSVLGAGWISFNSGVTGWCCGFFAVLIMTDLLEYLFHWAQHTIPVLWRMHEFHHSADHLDVTVTYRNFWVEPLIKMVFLYPLVGVVFRVPVTVGAAAGIVFTVAQHFIHMNVRFSLGRFTLWVNNPQYHRLHHSRNERDYKKNLCGLLPLWDILFGTLNRPARDEFVDVGLASGVAPCSLRQALLWPWRRPRQTGSALA